MKIQVTQENINQGKIAAGRSCAVALAVLEAFPSAKIVVGCDGININYNYFKMPDEVKRFVYAFDCGLSVTPFEFEIPNALP